MGESLKQILARIIQLSDQLLKIAGEALVSRQECSELKTRSDNLAVLLRQAARAPDLYERPARRIFADTEQSLEKSLLLAIKCRPHGIVSRVFTMLPAGSFKKAINLLDNSITNVSWLLRLSSNDDDSKDVGLPPIAQNEPNLSLIWVEIATLQTASSLQARAEAATALASYARGNHRHSNLIIEEDGVVPLLKLLKEGEGDGQENAAKAIRFLARDAESVEKMVQVGVCAALSKVLNNGDMRAQTEVANTVAELAGVYPECQDTFAQNDAVRFLVGHLAFETVPEHSKYVITHKPLSIGAVIDLANAEHLQRQHPAVAKEDRSTMPCSLDNSQDRVTKRGSTHAVVQSTTAAKVPLKLQNGGTTRAAVYNIGGSGKGRGMEDPVVKAEMKTMAAKALWQLAKGNPAICKSITESRALLCFAVLLEKDPDEVRYNSIMALMEIAKVAETDVDLRHSAFKPSSQAAKAVVDQLLKIVENAKYEEQLLIPAVVTLGCLARTFRATETRIIGPLVKLLDSNEPAVSEAAAVALTKFARKENFLHVEHCKAIIAAGAASHLIQLMYLGEQAQVPAAVLLSYVALNVPDSEELAKANVLAMLEWASKQTSLMQDPTLDTLVYEAKAKLELYQTRAHRGF